MCTELFIYFATVPVAVSTALASSAVDVSTTVETGVAVLRFGLWGGGGGEVGE